EHKPVGSVFRRRLEGHGKRAGDRPQAGKYSHAERVMRPRRWRERERASYIAWLLYTPPLGVTCRRANQECDPDAASDQAPPRRPHGSGDYMEALNKVGKHSFMRSRDALKAGGVY